MKRSVSVVLLVLAGVGLLAIGLWLGGVFSSKNQGGFSLLPKTQIDEKVTLSILKSQAVTFLVTRTMNTQLVIEKTESAWWGEWDGLLIVDVHWNWGVDLQKLSEKSLRREGDKLVCHLPDPELLSFGIEPGSERFMSKSTALPKMFEFANTGSQQKTLQDMVKTKAEQMAREKGLRPSRQEIADQLNKNNGEWKKAIGAEIRFE